MDPDIAMEEEGDTIDTVRFIKPHYQGIHSYTFTQIIQNIISSVFFMNKQHMMRLMLMQIFQNYHGIIVTRNYPGRYSLMC